MSIKPLRTELPDCAGCEQATIRLLKNEVGFRHFCFKHAVEVNGRDGWRDACGDLFRARERQRDLAMMREFAQ